MIVFVCSCRVVSHCYDRALSVAAGLDRQLIADKMRIMMELEHKVGVKQEDVINLVDYQYYHNLKPSQILMDAVNDKARTWTLHARVALHSYCEQTHARVLTAKRVVFCCV